MKRLDKLLHMQQYREAQHKIEKFEESRIYCRHSREHFIDVARIAYILALEEQLKVSKELIYTAAFLHDMGRCYEYQELCSHESGSIVMALNWLPECGYLEEEIKIIVEAIALHRSENKIVPDTLGSVLYRADKLSRDCLNCKARETCKWPEEKKNLTINY